MTWTQTLRQRWWLLPIAILVVAAAIVIRIITTPLEVSANVNDGDQAVPRTATIDLRFNQEMKVASVQHAFNITPSVPFAFKAVSPKEFQFRPTMKPSTAYHVSLKDAQNTSGRGVSSGFGLLPGSGVCSLFCLVISLLFRLCVSLQLGFGIRLSLRLGFGLLLGFGVCGFLRLMPRRHFGVHLGRGLRLSSLRHKHEVPRRKDSRCRHAAGKERDALASGNAGQSCGGGRGL